MPRVHYVDYSIRVPKLWFNLMNDLDSSWSEIVNVARGGLVFPLVQGYLNQTNHSLKCLKSLTAWATALMPDRGTLFCM